MDPTPITGHRSPVTDSQSPATQKAKAGLAAACKQMESLFVQEMIKSMRKAVTQSELFHGGRAEEIYTSLYDQQISQEIAESEGIGLYRMLYEQLENRLPDAK